jgi:hypothetical protein
MDDFLAQVEAGAKADNLYYLALAGALVIPDMCGALESQNGEAKGSHYKSWFDRHIAPMHGILTGEDCYRFRCSFLHQGRTQHPTGTYSRIVFVEPGAPFGAVFHMNVMNDALNIDVQHFCAEMVMGARNWLGQVRGTEPYESNLNKFVRRYPNGFAPYFIGVPVIS